MYLTKNIRNDVDYVNGMLVTVQAYNANTRSWRVHTTTGYTVYVYPWTDAVLGNKTYYPIRAGHLIKQ